MIEGGSSLLEEELHYLLMRAFHVSNREVVARVRHCLLYTSDAADE